MSVMFGIGFFEPLFVILFGGFGLPLGIPPLPEDPMLAKIAPQECLFYMSSSGMAVPDANSANQTEQLLAEPEVQRMISGIEQAIRSALKEVETRPGPSRGPSPAEIVQYVKLLLTRPAAVYVADITPPMQGPPDVHAGLVVNVGDAPAETKKLLENFLWSVSSSLIEVDGATWNKIQIDPSAPPIVVGMKGKYLLVAMGEGELENLLGRTKGNPPEWLTALRKKLPVDRVSSVNYVNLKKIFQDFFVFAPPEITTIRDALGLGNVTQIAAVSGLDETGYVSRSLIGLEGKPQGLLKALENAPLSAADLAAIPGDATFAVALRLDAARAFDAFVEFLGQVSPGDKEEFFRELGQMEEVLGLKIREDLLESLGDTICLYDSPSEGGLLVGLTAVVPLKDAKKAAAANAKFCKALQAAFRVPPDASPRQRLRAPRIDEFEFAGKKIYMFNPNDDDILIAPAWCITEKELIVALFPQGIKAYLAREKEFVSLAKAPEMEKTLQRKGDLLAVGYVNTPRLFDLVYPFLPVMAQYFTTEIHREGLAINFTSLLPAAGAIRRHLGPGVSTLRRTEAGFELTTRTPLPAGGLLAAAPLGLAITMPAMPQARQAARRAASMNNLKQIGIAIHCYHNAQNKFPPAYTVNKKGKPLLSWRVLILPYMDQDLYKQFHLDEPWDSAHNKKLIAKMPAAYRSPRSAAGEGKTNYLTVRGPKTIFPGKKGVRIADIVDGTSNTIMTVEAPDAKAVTWTKPDDFKYDKKNPRKGLPGLHPGGFLAGFADGSVRVISSSIDPQILKMLFTRDGGEHVNPDQIR